MRNIMINLETLSTSANAAILSISAADWDIELGIFDTFKRNIDVESSLSMGFDIELSTLEYLKKEKVYNINNFDYNRDVYNSLWTVLYDFSQWLKLEESNYQLWFNGSDFHCSILKNAYRKIGINVPWIFYYVRDYRTIISSFKYDSNSIKKTDDKVADQITTLNTIIKLHKLKDVL